MFRLTEIAPHLQADLQSMFLMSVTLHVLSLIATFFVLLFCLSLVFHVRTLQDEEWDNLLLDPGLNSM